MLYTVEVRPTAESGNFQIYTEEVEAATSHDAESRVQRANPNCNIRVCKSRNSDDSSSSSSSSSGTNVEGSAALIGIIAVLALAWWLLPWMLAGGAIYGGYKLSKKITGEDIDSLGKKSNEKAAFTMALIVALSGSVGFFGGKAIKGEFNAPAPAVEEVAPKEDL